MGTGRLLVHGHRKRLQGSFLTSLHRRVHIYLVLCHLKAEIYREIGLRGDGFDRRIGPIDSVVCVPGVLPIIVDLITRLPRESRHQSSQFDLLPRHSGEDLAWGDVDSYDIGQ